MNDEIEDPNICYWKQICKDMIIKRVEEIEETDDFLLCRKTESATHLFGKYSDNAAYHFVLSIIKERPQILKRLKKKL